MLQRGAPKLGKDGKPMKDKHGSYVTHSGEGEGLLFYGSTILPFVDHFPKNTELYRIMTTKPQELKKKEDE